MPDLRTLHGQHRADSNDASDPKPVPKQLTKFELQKDEIAIMNSWQDGFFIRFVFSPYWRAPFSLTWQSFSTDSFWDVFATLASPTDHVRDQLPKIYEKHSLFAMCPFSKRLAVVKTERADTWAQERNICVIYCTKTAKILTHMSFKETMFHLIAISPDGRFVAFGRAVQTHSSLQEVFVTIRRVSDGSIENHFLILVTVGNSIKAMAFDPECERLIILCQEKLHPSIYVLVRDLKTNGSVVDYHALVRPIRNKRGPTKYFLSSVLLFLPDHSIVIMFYGQGLLHFPSLGEVEEDGPIRREGSGEVETALDRAHRNGRLHPQGRLYAVRIPRERWESGVNPVNIDIYGQMQ